MEEISLLQFESDLNRGSSHHSCSQEQTNLNNESQSITNVSDIQMMIIPFDVVASGDEIIETYEMLQDGSLMQVSNDIQSKKLTRKRKRNVKAWKRTIAKANRQSGKPYKTRKGKIQPAKNVKSSGCSNPATCPFKCMTKINNEGRQAIFDSFWSLNDSEKRHFYVANVKKGQCKRKRTKANRSQKTYILNYCFNYMNEDVRVCQQFFVNTLNVDNGRVYYYFNQNKDRPTITPGPLRHGTHRKKVISEQQKQEVRDHINKFPVVESHYCRQNTEKKYLYQGLNLATMYRLYVAESEKPVKLSAYRYIFNYEFNLSFFRPKKDRCDKCMAFELLIDPTEEEAHDQNVHRLRKANASSERKKDRDISRTVHEENKSAIAGFDMENVFQLPISNASTIYYKRKFAVLNLTVAVNKIVYCAMWNESLCGREGTHIANALIKVLNQIVRDNPLLEYLTLWSDSCVPQNRNSIMSAAIQYFLNSSTSNLKRIEQKFSESGHGQVQEVDSAHSVIEKFLRNKFIYSPPSLIEEFKKIPERKFKFIVVPMEEDDYLDYQLLASAYKYTVVPFTKIKQVAYTKNQSKTLVKFDFDEDFVEKCIELKPRNTIDVGEIPQLTLASKLSAEKISDIQSMYQIMPESDKLFYQNVFKNSKLQVINEGSLEITTGEDTQISTSIQKSNGKINQRKPKSSLTQIKISKVPKVTNKKSEFRPRTSTISMNKATKQRVDRLKKTKPILKSFTKDDLNNITLKLPTQSASVFSIVKTTASAVDLNDTISIKQPCMVANIDRAFKGAASIIDLKNRSLEHPKHLSTVVSSVNGSASSIDLKNRSLEHPKHLSTVVSSEKWSASSVDFKNRRLEHPKHLSTVVSSVQGTVSNVDIKYTKLSTASGLICTKNVVDHKASTFKLNNQNIKNAMPIQETSPATENTITPIVNSSRVSTRKRKIPTFLRSFELTSKRIHKSK